MIRGMRRALVGFLVTSLSATSVAGQPGRFLVLPRAARPLLDAKYPGWRVAPVIQPVREELLVRAPGADPNIIAGDFNGDGREDYVVLLQYERTAARGAPDVIDEAAALIASGSTFEVIPVAGFPPNNLRYLTLERKGNEGRSRDAIAVRIVGGTATVYVYASGRFTSANAR
jgi:hypothetical protein